MSREISPFFENSLQGVQNPAARRFKMRYFPERQKGHGPVLRRALCAILPAGTKKRPMPQPIAASACAWPE